MASKMFFSGINAFRTFIKERNRSNRLMASENVSELKPKNLVRESRSFTSSSLSLVVILRPLSWEISMNLKPLSFGWYRPSRSVRAFSCTAKGCAPGPVTASIICAEGEAEQSHLDWIKLKLTVSKLEKCVKPQVVISLRGNLCICNICKYNISKYNRHTYSPCWSNNMLWIPQPST